MKAAMRKAAVITLACLLLFAGCRAKQVYTVYSKGVTYTVDKAEQTITDGKDIYTNTNATRPTAAGTR